MSLPTPETLLAHELAGLRVAVVDAPNPDLVGVAGRVVDETTRTLEIEGPEAPGSHGQRDGPTAGQSRVRQVPKAGTTFEFALTDEAAASREGAGTASKRSSETADAGASEGSAVGQSGGCEGAAYVTVDGARLLSRPARRTENGGTSKWH